MKIIAPLSIVLLASACGGPLFGTEQEPKKLCAVPGDVYTVSYFVEDGNCGSIPNTTAVINSDGCVSMSGCTGNVSMVGCTEDVSNCPSTIFAPELSCTITSAQFTLDGNVGSGIENIVCGNCSGTYTVILNKE